ncbi:MAG: SRPBCC family protein [Glaciecola sp.]
MFNIRVERTINKPIKEVFDYISDHANYAQFKGVDTARLVKAGEQDENGLGAVREMVAAGATLHEAIVRFEPPYILGYKIVYSKPLPYKHLLGEITLSETQEGTKAVWVSQGTIDIPLLGKWYFDKQIQKHGSRAFGSILKFIDAA